MPPTFEIVYRFDPTGRHTPDPPADPAAARRRLEAGNHEFAVLLDPRTAGETRRVVRFDADDLAGRVIGLVAGWRAAGQLDGHGHQILDAHTSVLINVCGACERIRSTPLPGSYLSLLRHGLILALVLTPWQLAITLGAWAIPAQAVLVYFLFGVELTAEEVEQPFGFDGDDLPLERYCETIRAGAAEVLGVAGAGK